MRRRKPADARRESVVKGLVTDEKHAELQTAAERVA